MTRRIEVLIDPTQPPQVIVDFLMDWIDEIAVEAAVSSQPFVESVPMRLVEHPGHGDQKVHGRRGAGGDDGIPKEPGTTPVPDGMVRGYHYTSKQALPSILEQGLDVAHAKGESYGEPNVLWMSTKKPSDDVNYIEAHVRPDEMGVGRPGYMGAKANVTQKELDDFNASDHNFTLTLDQLPASRIVAYNEPWHSVARRLMTDYGPGTAAGKAARENGEFDTMESWDDGTWAPAVRYWKSKMTLSEARLVEHPGHQTGTNQKVHGRKPIGAADLDRIKAGKRPATGPERSAARDSLAMARAAEPAVSADLARIAKSIGAEQAGLQHKLKTEDSLARKVAGDVDQRNLTPQRAADQIYDALRYTNTYSAAKYTKGVNDAEAAMTSAGYTLVRRKNSWGDGPNYQGINEVWQSPKGQLFELQHHTPQSLKLKDPSHAHFEIMRATPSLRQAKRERQAIAALWDHLNDHPPAGSAAIPDVNKL